MFIKRTAATGLILFALHGALAQDLNLLPLCAALCVERQANALRCAFPTRDCVCPARQLIKRCIARTCGIMDRGSSQAIIDALCAQVPLPPPSTSPSIATLPPPPPPTTLTVIVGPLTIPVLPPPSSLSPFPSITFPAYSSNPPSSTPLIPTVSNVTLLSGSPVTTTRGTVVVLSTQFAPDPTETSSASVLCSHALHIMGISAGLVGILII